MASDGTPVRFITRCPTGCRRDLAAAVTAAVTSPEPRPLFVAPAPEIPHAAFDRLRAAFDAWRQATLGAGHPEHRKAT